MIVVPARNPSEWTGRTGNNTYLLAGAVPALVDAGVGHPDHLDAVANALGGAPLALVLITHGHPDHVAGLPALAARWPGLRVAASAQLASIFPSSFAPLHDGDELQAGDVRLRAIHTPGHSPDHFCFFDSDTGDVFCGDLVRMEGTIVIPASQGGRLVDYLASLRRIRDLEPARLLPGHGPAIDDPARIIETYLRHRAERELQIVDALRAGCSTADEIVATVYGTLSAAIAAAAAESVLAHLVKLIEDGMVTRDRDTFTLDP